MNKMALTTFKLVDVLIWLVDATQPPGRGDAWVAEALKKSGRPVLVVFNKSDLKPAVTPEDFLAQMAVADWPWVRVSALTGEGLPELLARLEAAVPKGPSTIRKRCSPTARSHLSSASLSVKPS